MQRIDALIKNRAIWLLLMAPILLRLPLLLGWLSVDPLVIVGHLGDRAQLSTGTPWIDPNVGYQAQALGKLSADLWLEGQVPWWNSFNGAGLPLAAEFQPAALFLPFVLLYHFRQGFLWLEIILQIISGLCTYAVLRKLNLSRLAALVAGLLFEFNGTFAWHSPPIVSPIAFLPMLILGVEILIAKMTLAKPGGWWLVSVALAFSIYSGFPETAYINGLFTTLWVLCRLPYVNRPYWHLFLGKLSLAVFIGLLLSAPQIIPFVEYTTHSYVGGHDGTFSHASLPAETAAVSLAPWLYGPIFGFNDPWSGIRTSWANIGGYFTALQVLLLFVAIQLSPRRLTIGSFAWMALCLGKTFDIEPISYLFNLIPLVKSVAFYRYAAPSWEFAGIVVIAFGIDAIQRGEKVDYKRSALAFITLLLSVALALFLAQKPMVYLLLQDKARVYVYIALFWLISSLLACLLCLRIKQHSYVAPAIACALVLDALFAFALPMLSAARDVHINEPGIAFLKASIGLQRAYSMRQLAPNYGAYFQIAQIDHNYLPVDGNWIHYIHAKLDPAVDPVVFNGYSPHLSGYGSSIDQLKGRLSAYGEVGVKYILTPPGLDILSDGLRVGTASTSHATMTLSDGQDMAARWEIPSTTYERTLRGISVPIGNYAGTADGQLIVQICITNSTCATASGDLKNSADNSLFDLKFDRELIIPESTNFSFIPLDIKFSHSNATHPVAIWMTDFSAFQTGNISLKNAHTSKAPAISLLISSEPTSTGPRLVYSGPDMSIYELPDGKPYFEVTQGNCSIHAISRTQAQLNCLTPATLLRREEFYPGWMVKVDGIAGVLEHAHGLFQDVTLSAGPHVVTYVYYPIHYRLLVVCFVIGILLLLYGAWRDMQAPSRSI